MDVTTVAAVWGAAAGTVAAVAALKGARGRVQFESEWAPNGVEIRLRNRGTKMAWACEIHLNGSRLAHAKGWQGPFNVDAGSEIRLVAFPAMGEQEGDAYIVWRMFRRLPRPRVMQVLALPPYQLPENLRPRG